MSSKAPNAIPGQQQLSLEEAVFSEAQEAARQRGLQLAADFTRDPISFGADWPSAQINRRAREDAADTTAVVADEAEVTTPERAVLGSRARKDLGAAAVRPEVPLAPIANPYGRSPAALRAENEMLAQQARSAR